MLVNGLLLNSSDTREEIFHLIWSVPCLLMPWLQKSPEHQQAWYWLCRTDSVYCCFRVNYTPLQRSWKWGILISPCLSVRPSVCHTVRPSVPHPVSALLRLQFWLDPFHIYTSYQEGVSLVKFIAKLQNLNFVNFFKFVTLTLSCLDFGSDVNHLYLRT